MTLNCNVLIILEYSQGCCVSRSEGPNSPYPGGAPDSSSRAINPSTSNNPTAEAQQQGQQQQSTSADPSSSSSPTQQQQRRRRREQQRPLDQHIDKPLRRHVWTSTNRTWSTRQLARERAEFFDTRVSGRPEVWQAVHAALMILWEPTEEGADDTAGFATAQAILSAAEISLPSGNLAQGVFDSLGYYYPIPEYIVADPTNVVTERPLPDSKADLSTGADDTAADDDETDADSDKRAEKGKGVVSVEEQISIKARLSENGRDYQVLVGKTEPIRSVSKKIAEQASVSLPARLSSRQPHPIIEQTLTNL